MVNAFCAKIKLITHYLSSRLVITTTTKVPYNTYRHPLVSEEPVTPNAPSDRMSCLSKCCKQKAYSKKMLLSFSLL